MKMKSIALTRHLCHHFLCLCFRMFCGDKKDFLTEGPTYLLVINLVNLHKGKSFHIKEL